MFPELQLLFLVVKWYNSNDPGELWHILWKILVLYILCAIYKTTKTNIYIYKRIYHKRFLITSANFFLSIHKEAKHQRYVAPLHRKWRATPSISTVMWTVPVTTWSTLPGDRAKLNSTGSFHRDMMMVNVTCILVKLWTCTTY